MRRVVLMVLLSIAMVAAADKDKPRFAPGPATSYPGHQTAEKITIAAIPYFTEELAHLAFDKPNPNKYGVLPILVVIDNGTGRALRLDLRPQYIDVDNRHVDATPVDDVLYIGGDVRAPRMPGTNPNPLPFPRRAKHGPLNTPEIAGRAFSARMLPVGESASGFFYFQTGYHPGSRLYITGIKDAGTAKDYFYFELPLDQK
jgi:hypothetical protein